jgi:iron(III) transport system substrate-binding protein
MQAARAISSMLTACACAVTAAGCREDDTNTVVVYCSVDETFGRQVLDAFQARTGVTVQAIFDTEAGKTTGLVKRIELERRNPQADVFWSSEVFNTIVLARKDVFEPYDSPAARDIPARYRDPAHRWTAIGLRGRVLAFDPKTTPREAVPRDWEALAAPGTADKLAFANPLFGTTRGHVAAMFALWGPARATSFLQNLRDHGAQIVDGNSTAVRELASGRVLFAATDTDDVVVANRGGAAMEASYPDMGDGGTLLIPNSIAIPAGAPHGKTARRLVDFLVSAEVEEMLARSASRNIPVRPALRAKLTMSLPPETRISYDAVADAMPAAVEAVRETLIR